jgi:hypothetical protein
VKHRLKAINLFWNKHFFLRPPLKSTISKGRFKWLQSSSASEKKKSKCARLTKQKGKGRATDEEEQWEKEDVKSGNETSDKKRNGWVSLLPLYFPPSLDRSHSRVSVKHYDKQTKGIDRGPHLKYKCFSALSGKESCDKTCWGVLEEGKRRLFFLFL